jgi:hypothetical protein
MRANDETLHQMKSRILQGFIAVRDLWVGWGTPDPLPPLVDENGELRPPPSPAQARIDFRYALTEYVRDGWSIEIENELDAVLSRKAKFSWFGKLIIFVILLLVWFPLAFFYLIVVVVRGVTAKPRRIQIWMDEDGRINKE